MDRNFFGSMEIDDYKQINPVFISVGQCVYQIFTKQTQSQL